MILEFVWIENYGALNNQGFNFNPNVSYFFDKNTGELSRQERHSIPTDFFHIENDTIARISAIVGANGTGKSTALQFISSFLTTHRPLGGLVVTDKYIINKSDHQIVFSQSWEGERQLLIDRVELIKHYRKAQQGWESNDIEDSRNHKLGLRILDNLINDTRLIYYSGEPNLRHTNRVYESMLSLADEFENSHFSDISDIALTASDQSDYRSQNAIYSGENVLLTHRSGESQRFINLILGPYKNVIPFSINHFDVSIHFNDISSAFFQSYDELGFKPIVSTIENEIKEKKSKGSRQTLSFLERLRDYGIHGYFENKYGRVIGGNKNIDKVFFHHLLLRHIREQIMRTMGELTEHNKYSMFVSILSDIEKSFSSTQNYSAQIRHYFASSKIAGQYVGRLNIDAADRFVEKMKSMQDWNDDVIVSGLTDPKLSDFTKAIQTFDLESGLRYSIESIFDFDFRGLSTGEKQFLKIFSRFVSAGLNNANNPFKESAFIILIDEFENGFHPSWQRKFLKTWIDFLEGYVNQSQDKKIKVQLIFTSHSPFIVSDLPKSCINFLYREPGAEYSKVDDLQKHQETLGANIHDLYADSFFLEDALIGNFAKDKINRIIQQLTDPTKPIEKPKELRTLIERIGEPIIKTKLLEKLAERMNENPEIARLRAQRDHINIRLKQIEPDDSNQTNPSQEP